MSTLLKRNQCSVGMIVKLTHPDSSYSLGPANPRIGTEWECTGRITEVYGDTINVSWKNGFTNSYKDNELSLLSLSSCIDLWEEI
jgi:hypothetical protein